MPASPRLWAVYECTDGAAPVVWPLFRSAEGDYVPFVCRRMPALSPLPVHVFRSRAAADRLAVRLVWACAGTA